MGTFAIQQTIAAPPAAVFAVLADVARTPQWYSAIEEVHPLPGPPSGLGAAYTVTRALPGGRAVNEVAITAFEPAKRFTMASRSGPTPFIYAYTLQKLPSGARLTLDGTISTEGLPGPLTRLGSLGTSLFAKGMGTNLAVLARLVENDGRLI